MSCTFIPVNSIKKSFLMDVQPSAYSRSIKKTRQRGASGIAKLFQSAQDEASSNFSFRSLSAVTLNIAGWVSLPIEIRRPVSLIAVYTDNTGEHGVLVEEIEARGASQILLSGVVDLKAVGPIRGIKLYCGGLNDPRVGVQHMHVQKVKGEHELPSLQAC